MKNYVVYCKKLRDKLLDAGFIESKPPERNIHNPYYLVFFFEDTPMLRNKMEELIHESVSKQQ